MLTMRLDRLEIYLVPPYLNTYLTISQYHSTTLPRNHESRSHNPKIPRERSHQNDEGAGKQAKSASKISDGP